MTPCSTQSSFRRAIAMTMTNHVQASVSPSVRWKFGADQLIMVETVRIYVLDSLKKSWT